MTEAQARQALLARLGELALEDRISAEGREPVTLQPDSVGRLSRMDAMQQQAMAHAQQRRREQERRRIRAALVRMDEGEWGSCLTCGDDIAPGRLAHDPSVAVCVGCASGEG
ncbi:MAG: TraR/DksA C4-type zinc finger protein [Pseudomonadota bacterium]